jgi:Ca-activated chloride channel family protein
MISDFHFLRPLWLFLLIVPLVLIIVMRRRSDLRRQWQEMIAPQLLNALILNGDRRRRMLPATLFALVLTLLALGIAGPSWYREQPPFVQDTASLVIAVDLGQSMDATDIQPSRIERAKLKIHDILNQRMGARTAVIAYAGTAHLVIPLTSDASLITSYTEALSTALMPRPGRDSVAALNAATTLLQQDGTPGTILFMTDGIETAAADAFRTVRGADVIILGIGTAAAGVIRPANARAGVQSDGAEPGSETDPGALQAFASQARAAFTMITDDDSDVRWISERVHDDFEQQQSKTGSHWHDSGWWFILAAGLLLAISFRRGWVVRLAFTGMILHTAAPDAAKADPLADMWLTHDQQGRRAFERQDYARAATLFADPMWRGVSAYRAGRYQAALDAFSALDTPAALYNQGNTLLNLRKFSEAISAYQAALKKKPDFEDAQLNLATAKRLLAASQQQQDEAQDPSLKPDGSVFDDKAKNAKAGQVALARQTSQLWISNIAVSPAAMLARRFALEADASQSGKPQ